MSQRAILITGATGKQGGAVIDALLALPSSNANFTILAVTRNTESGGAKKLAAKSSSIKLVHGDLDDVPSIFSEAVNVAPVGEHWSVLWSTGASTSELRAHRRNLTVK
jgi:uncharacterized protein YbjT (DUF2867 family)